MLRESVIATVLALADTGNVSAGPAELMTILTGASMRLLEVDAAAVLLIDDRGDLIPAAATHLSLGPLDAVQSELGEGPCADSARGIDAVCSTDLEVEGRRWPSFSAIALEEGYRSVHTEPLYLRDEFVGALTMFRRRPGALPGRGHRDARYLAAAATIGLLHGRVFQRVQTENVQLKGALESRIEIEQAKGALAERHGLDPDVAFEMLRHEARRQGLPLRQVAAAVRRHRPRTGPDTDPVVGLPAPYRARSGPDGQH